MADNEWTTYSRWMWQVPKGVFDGAQTGLVQLYYADEEYPQEGDELILESKVGMGVSHQVYHVVSSAIMIGQSSGKTVLRMQLSKVIAA
jgi:hypothetical protein